VVAATACKPTDEIRNIGIRPHFQNVGCCGQSRERPCQLPPGILAMFSRRVDVICRADPGRTSLFCLPQSSDFRGFGRGFCVVVSGAGRWEHGPELDSEAHRPSFLRRWRSRSVGCSLCCVGYEGVGPILTFRSCHRWEKLQTGDRPNG